MRGQDTRSDADILAVLERRAAGEACSAIAARSGVSRSTIVGLVYRVNLDPDRAESTPPPCGPVAGDKARKLRRRYARAVVATGIAAASHAGAR